MSRCDNDYDDYDALAVGRWHGAVKSATNGARGQAFLQELLSAIDAMPVKELIPHELRAEGGFCTLGVIGQKRGLRIEEIDPEDHKAVARSLGVAEALAYTIAWHNDEHGDDWVMLDGRYVYVIETSAKRWQRMRDWVAKQITEPSREAVSCGPDVVR